MIQTKLIMTHVDSRAKRDIDAKVNEWLASNPEVQVMDIKFTTVLAIHLSDYLDSVLIVYETGDE